MKFTTWALAQAEARKPGGAHPPQMALQALVDSLSASRRGVGQVFGMEASSFEPEGKASVEAAVIGALVAWRDVLLRDGDGSALLDLDRLAVAHDVEALRLRERIPLRCDPLGERAALSAPWRARLADFDDALAGRRAFDWSAVDLVVAQSERAIAVSSAAPDPDGLYAFALRYETQRKRAFPPEIAALWTAANGLAVNDDCFLAPVAAWRWDADGLCIGSGGYLQGQLMVRCFTTPLEKAKVEDRDDDGELRKRYRNFAGFLDALLGR